MRNTWIIFKREMMAYFFSPIAYLMGMGTLLPTGFSFYAIVRILNQEPGPYTPSDWFFNGMFTWIILLFVVPVITMRLFSEEKKTGILEGIMTAPVTDTEYVLGKYFSAMVFYVVMWAPTFSYIFILRHFAKDSTPLDLGPTIGGYIGLFLFGVLLNAIGCFASALTRNQIIAAIVTFAFILAFFLTGIFFYFNSSGTDRNIFEYVSMLTHAQELTRGVLDWKRVVFYFSGAFFFLFLTHRVIQSRQWKG
jgi:ABC-2 type transport system permease protein